MKQFNYANHCYYSIVPRSIVIDEKGNPLTFNNYANFENQSSLKFQSIYKNGVLIVPALGYETCRANFNNEVNIFLLKIKDYLLSNNINGAFVFDSFIKCNDEIKKSVNDERMISNAYDDSLIYLNDEYKKLDKIFLLNDLCVKIQTGKSNENILQNPKRFAKVLDIVVGNTCVILDRDKEISNIRKTLAKAGSYSVSEEIFNYNVLTNFYLKSQTLVSLVLGLTKFCSVMVCDNNDSIEGKNYVNTLFSLVNEVDIINAINNNDYDLAVSNFNKIKNFICSVVGNYSESFPISSKNLARFEYFYLKGIDYWFSNYFVHWTSNYIEGHGGLGFESFLSYHVEKDMVDKRKELANISLEEIALKFKLKLKV